MAKLPREYYGVYYAYVKDAKFEKAREYATPRVRAFMTRERCRTYYVAYLHNIKASLIKLAQEKGLI